MLHSPIIKSHLLREKYVASGLFILRQYPTSPCALFCCSIHVLFHVLVSKILLVHKVIIIIIESYHIKLDLCEAAYCVNSTNHWSCSTCDSNIVLSAVIEVNGARALVGYDGNYNALFVAYRGSSDIQNWIDNVRFLKTAPYSDMPDVKVEKGFYEWYTDLKPGVDNALETLKNTYSTSNVKITGHSAGGAVATLHAFDMARGEVIHGNCMSVLFNLHSLES